jgi:hypothetical protein
MFHGSHNSVEAEKWCVMNQMTQWEKLSCIVRRSRMLLYRDLISYPCYVSLRSVFHLILSPNHCLNRVQASNAFYAPRGCLGPTMGRRSLRTSYYPFLWYNTYSMSTCGTATRHWMLNDHGLRVARVGLTVLSIHEHTLFITSNVTSAYDLYNV